MNNILLDIGGTFIKGCVTAPDGVTLMGDYSVSIDSDGEASVIENAIRDAVAEGISLLGSFPDGIGIDIPGPFDYAEGIFLMQHKFKAVYGRSLREMVLSVPGVAPSTKMAFAHDVNTLVLGEMSFGNAVGYKNVAVVTLGTGLGFAVATDGRLRQNEKGGPEFSLWNTPYNGGILEDFVSKRGFIRAYEEASGAPTELAVKDIADLAHSGDKTAAEAFNIATNHLVAGLKPFIERFTVECLLFGGQISRSIDLMEPQLRSAFGTLSRLSIVSDLTHAPMLGTLSLLQ